MSAEPTHEPGQAVPSDRPRVAAPPLITIASEHGARSHLVAPRVAEALGVPFLDRALPADPEAPDTRPGSVIGSLARASTMLADAPGAQLDAEDARLRAELAEFLARASASGGVVLGRGGVLALAGAPGVLHVLLTGPREGRVRLTAEQDGLTLEAAEQRVRRHDRARLDYVRRAFGVDPDDRRLYHLILDTVALGVDVAVEAILVAARVRPQQPPAHSAEE
jgi:cytidylate kinase